MCGRRWGRGAAGIVRQLLTESVLLAGVGGLAGLAVAYAGTRTAAGAGVFQGLRVCRSTRALRPAVLGVCFRIVAGDRGY